MAHRCYMLQSISNYVWLPMPVIYIDSIVVAVKVSDRWHCRETWDYKIYYSTVHRIICVWYYNGQSCHSIVSRCSVAITVQRILIEFVQRIRAIRHRDSGYPARTGTFGNLGSAVWARECRISMCILVMYRFGIIHSTKSIPDDEPTAAANIPENRPSASYNAMWLQWVDDIVEVDNVSEWNQWIFSVWNYYNLFIFFFPEYYNILEANEMNGKFIFLICFKRQHIIWFILS